MVNNSPHIHLSIYESDIFQLKTGRYHANRIDADIFKTELQAHHFDLLNVRIRKGEDISVLNQLTDYALEKMVEIKNFEMNFPMQYHLSLNHEDIEFVAATFADKAILDKLIDESMSEEPIGYFKTTLLKSYVNPIQELQVLKQYYAHFLEDEDHNKVIWLLQDQSQFCAFIAHEYDEVRKTLNCPLSGILPAYRQLGIFSDIGRFTFRRAEALGGIRFSTGARANNHASIKAFEKEFLQHYASDEVYILLHKKWLNFN